MGCGGVPVVALLCVGVGVWRYVTSVMPRDIYRFGKSYRERSAANGVSGAERAGLTISFYYCFV